MAVADRYGAGGVLLARDKEGVSLQGVDARTTVLDARGQGSMIFANKTGTRTRAEGLTIGGRTGNDLAYTFVRGQPLPKTDCPN